MNKLEELIQELCPNGVKYRTVGDICNICRGVVISKDFIRDNVGAYPVYSSQTENNGELGKINTYSFDGEYLTWTTDGANAGSVFYRNGKFSVTNVCGVLEMKDNNISAKFLFYVLQTSVKPYVNKGMGNPKLMSNVMARVKVPVPPIEVQEEIVRILDKFTELSAELTAELSARKKQYNYFCDKLLTQSNHISYKKVKDLAKFTYGFTDKAKDAGNVRYIRITDIDETGCLKHDDKKFLNISENNHSYLLKKGDLVMARTGATFGKTLYFEDNEPSIYASFLIKIELDNNKILNRFYWHFSKSSLYWEQANNLVSTGGQPQFNTGAIGQVVVPVPPLEEQERIVAILDRFDKICNDISEGLPAEIEARQKQYEYYRDKLLTFEEIAQ